MRMRCSTCPKLLLWAFSKRQHKYLCLHTSDVAVELSSRHERYLEILEKAKVICVQFAKSFNCCAVGWQEWCWKARQLNCNQLCAYARLCFNERKIKYGWYKYKTLKMLRLLKTEARVSETIQAMSWSYIIKTNFQSSSKLLYFIALFHLCPGSSLLVLFALSYSFRLRNKLQISDLQQIVGRRMTIRILLLQNWHISYLGRYLLISSAVLCTN